MSTKITTISDLHGNLPETPECDILIIAGDIGPANRLYHDAGKYAYDWIKLHFKPWLKQQPAKYIVGIAGNHDFIAQDAPAVFDNLPWNYLCDSRIKLCGLTIHGSPYTPQFGQWAFMKPDHKLVSNWRHISKHTDVLVTHGPPFGILDQNQLGERCGSQSLRDRLDEVHPRLHIFGHIHESHGQVEEYGPTIYANASILDEHYKQTPKILSFEFD